METVWQGARDRRDGAKNMYIKLFQKMKYRFKSGA